jgi:hypothetical protein
MKGKEYVMIDNKKYYYDYIIFDYRDLIENPPIDNLYNIHFYRYIPMFLRIYRTNPRNEAYVVGFSIKISNENLCKYINYRKKDYKKYVINYINKHYKNELKINCRDM